MVNSNSNPKKRVPEEENKPHLFVFRIPLFWGILVRLALWYYYPTLSRMLDDRVEVTTPITSFKRLLEGIYLFQNGINVYEGGAFHQSPLILIVFYLLPRICYPIVFILSDYIVAKCLVELAMFKLDDWKQDWPEAIYATEDNDETPMIGTVDTAMIGTVDTVEDETLIPKMKKIPFKDPLEDESLHPKGDPTKPIDIPIVPNDIGSIYLLNPLSIMTCMAQNTQLFSTLSIAIALACASKGQRRASMLALSFGTYLTIYPCLLVAPCILFLNLYHEKKRSLSGSKSSGEKFESLNVTIFKSLGGLICYTSGLLYLSFLLMGNWSFLKATYGVIIFVNDLQPTVGLFWYFFMEVFDQFRIFFLTVFHLNVFVFTIPVCIKFRTQPLLVSFLVCASISLFKSYPSIADLTLYLSLISMHFELFKYAPHLYLAISGLLYSALLGPLFFNSWVYNGGGNANFFYAITLVWSVSQIMLCIDLVYAYIKREFERLHPGWRRMRVELLYQYED